MLRMEHRELYSKLCRNLKDAREKELIKENEYLQQELKQNIQRYYDTLISLLNEVEENINKGNSSIYLYDNDMSAVVKNKKIFKLVVGKNWTFVITEKGIRKIIKLVEEEEEKHPWLKRGIK